MTDREPLDGAEGRAGASEDELRLAEEIGYTFHSYGVGRMESRVLGWLLICDPPEQHAAQIAEALQASRGSISMAIRSLSLANLVERVPRLGDRRDYYQFPPDAWESVLLDQQRQTAAFQQLADRGLAVLADAPAERKERLQRLNDLFEWYAEEFPKILTSWQAFRDARRRQRAQEQQRPKERRPREQDKEQDNG